MSDWPSVISGSKNQPSLCVVLQLPLRSSCVLVYLASPLFTGTDEPYIGLDVDGRVNVDVSLPGGLNSLRQSIWALPPAGASSFSSRLGAAGFRSSS